MHSCDIADFCKNLLTQDLPFRYHTHSDLRAMLPLRCNYRKVICSKLHRFLDPALQHNSYRPHHASPMSSSHPTSNSTPPPGQGFREAGGEVLSALYLLLDPVVASAQPGSQRLCVFDPSSCSLTADIV